MPRRNLNSLSPAERSSLRDLILAYLSDAVVAAHATITHQDIHIFTGHRSYIEDLEGFLVAQGAQQFVPLPAWDPAQPIPPEFNVVKPQDNGAQRPALQNLTPNMPKPSQFAIPAVWLFPNGDDLGNAVDSPWHGSLHGAVGGTMQNFQTASAAPIFWCWHAFVDEIYSDWDQRVLVGRPLWTGKFSQTTSTEVLYFYDRDTDWWLGSSSAGQFQWRSAGSTTGFGAGHILGQPTWVGSVSPGAAGRSQVLFYNPGDDNWWLGAHNGSRLAWTFAGNTTGFGAGHALRQPLWLGGFSSVGGAQAEVLFYNPGDDNWWLGTHDGNQLVWTFAGNTSGFGPGHLLGQAVWTGSFSPGATGRTEVLFYYPGDGNWWLGSHDGNQLVWTLVGNTLGFGQVWDGRPFWVGDFNGDGRSDLLFYYPGDGNWWLGSHDGNQLAWTLVGNTLGFGQVGDGRPFWVGNFARSDRAEVLFYFPGDGNWWLGSYDGNQLAWSFAGNTFGFGQVWDGRPFWVGDFNGDGRADMLFHYPGDGNWWSGSHTGQGGQLQWSFAGNRCHPRV